MIFSDKIKHQLVLEVLGTLDLILPSVVQKASLSIMYLKLDDHKFSRFLIHTYQNGFVGENSHKFRTILRKCIKKNNYLKLVETLNSLNQTWPELSDPENKITGQQMKIITGYYKFQHNFIHTVFKRENQILKQMDFYLYEINPFYSVKYEVDKQKAGKSPSFYKKCFDIYRKNGGSIPLLILH